MGSTPIRLTETALATLICVLAAVQLGVTESVCLHLEKGRAHPFRWRGIPAVVCRWLGCMGCSLMPATIVAAIVVVALFAHNLDVRLQVLEVWYKCILLCSVCCLAHVGNVSCSLRPFVFPPALPSCTTELKRKPQFFGSRVNLGRYKRRPRGGGNDCCPC